MKLYSIEEASQLLAVSKLTIKRWHKRGYITCKRIGPRGDHKVPQSEIERIMGVSLESGEVS